VQLYRGGVSDDPEPLAGVPGDGEGSAPRVSSGIAFICFVPELAFAIDVLHHIA
jgi:hypothetical protein